MYRLGFGCLMAVVATSGCEKDEGGEKGRGRDPDEAREAREGGGTGEDGETGEARTAGEAGGAGETPGRATKRDFAELLRKPRWPKGFKVARELDIKKPKQVEGFSKRLGGRVERIRNYFLNDGEQKLQVNIIRTASVGDAKRIMATFRKQMGAKASRRISRHGRYVVELVGATPGLKMAFKRSMGLLDRSRRVYKVKARLGLVEKSDQAVINELFNLFTADRPSAATKAAMRERARKLEFGKSLRLRRAPTSGGRPKYELEPKPDSERVEGAGSTTVYTFSAPKRFHGVPYVDVVATVPTRGFRPAPVSEAESGSNAGSEAGSRSGSEPRPEPRSAPRSRSGAPKHKLTPKARKLLTRQTRYWPTESGKVRSLVQEIVSPNDSDLLKLRKLVGWISTKVTYGGKRVGSRDPVAAVLERRFGRCWEKADLLVTLARAARLPTRQVAGWLVGGQGHIWVEVLVEGRGWLSVDATAPWIGVAGSYVPLMTTTDGHMPVMHLKKPKIERLDGKSR